MSLDQKDSTLAALLKDKPKRGRPRRAVERQNVYVALTPQQKLQMKSLSKALPAVIRRSDIPDLTITALTVRLESMRQSVAGRTREMPEGITEFDSLYLLWDLEPPDKAAETKWTTIRVSPQQGIELGRAHGGFNALFGTSRSEVFALGLSLFSNQVEQNLLKAWDGVDAAGLQLWIAQNLL